MKAFHIPMQYEEAMGSGESHFSGTVSELWDADTADLEAKESQIQK